MPKTFPTLTNERDLLQAGHAAIAGLHEAGRGAWAGPVSAGAVILPVTDPTLQEQLRGVTDSKLCTPRQRDAYYEVICEVALAWLLHNPIVTAPIIGPRTIEQLESAVRATDIELDEETIKQLDEIFPGPGGEAPMAYAW